MASIEYRARSTRVVAYVNSKGLIDKNPFEGVAVGKATNDDRRVFVSREVIQRVLDKCPNWQWKTVVALARYGGLRCSSEVALLKWSDIHWDIERFTVTSPKTKRYGKTAVPQESAAEKVCHIPRLQAIGRSLEFDEREAVQQR